MRKIVIGQRATSQPGIQEIAVWFRLTVPVARQPYYAKQQASYSPVAPGDYSGSGPDNPEIALFQSGAWLERSFFDIIDPTSNAATIENRLQNLYAAAQSAVQSADDAALANWGSYWDGTTWTLKSS